MSLTLIKKARERAMTAIRELKRLDRRLTSLGCLNAHIHHKTRTDDNGATVRTNMMYLLAPQDRKTKRRHYTYIGVKETKQKSASERIARFKLRERLRKRIAMLKSALRRADEQLSATLKTYKDLADKARRSVRDFSRNARQR